MSILKVKKIQVGDSATASQNFTIMVPTTPDGTLEIRRGNADAPGALLAKVNADGGVNTGGAVFSAYAAATQTLVNGDTLRINFATEEIDTTNAYDATNSKFQPTVAGWYYINACVAVAAASTGTFLTSIRKNGVVNKWGSVQAMPNSNRASVSGLVYLNGTTDYIEIGLWQNSGVSMATNGANTTDQTYFQGYFLRAA